ncbi:succinylglutamate desuccinylase [Marinomonas sp. A79]|uniref:Succinylglutamate desuccinylase n=1 Tax=Marinomonas vulgaris TaxID=2823372 RepID=A0ABS5HCT4_9GAMM|nr:succinylglutamate desuccinylase [Marinomonas vulgaris]MBR7889468.1 succinylglutamate desuccinylase [Marinomonas vulgaris]
MTIPNNDFLALTLAHQEAIEPFSFSFLTGTAFVEDTGILRLEPNTPSDVNLVLSVGVHGNETGPIELVNQLVSQLLTGKLTLKVRLLVLIGNPVAANQAKRFCEVNLNRLFVGVWQQYEGYEASRAERLEQAISDFFAPIADKPEGLKLHYDLHTAIRGSEYEKFAVYPYVENAVYHRAQLEFLAASGIDAVLFSHQATTTFSYYSHKVHGAHSFTIELGKVHAFGENDLSRFADINTSLTTLLTRGYCPRVSASTMTLFKVLDSLIKDDDSYRLNLANDVKNFTQFDEGFVLAESIKSQYLVEKTGDALVFPNTQLPIGQRAGLMVRPITQGDLTLN